MYAVPAQTGVVNIPEIENEAGGVQTTVLLLEATLSHSPISVSLTVTSAFVNHLLNPVFHPVIVHVPSTAVVVVAPSTFAPSVYN